VASAGVRYVAVVLALLVAAIAGAWFWSARMPLAFLDPEYAAAAAKQQLLRECDVGATLIVGDSRAGAGLVPRHFSEPATNVAAGGDKPVEVYFAVRRALACPRPPKRVVISLSAGLFCSVNTFWDRSARFGFFSFDDLREIRRDTAAIGDDSLYLSRRSDGLPDVVRDWIYAHSFPSVNFASMLRGGVFLRYGSNRVVLEETLAARGHRLFGRREFSHDLAEEALMEHFDVLPMAAFYFEQTLAALAARGIPAFFVVMPVNETTYTRMSPHVWEDFSAFVRSYEVHFPNFQLTTGAMPHLPDEYFGDNYAHLNARGAELFSQRVDRMLRSLSVEDRSRTAALDTRRTNRQQGLSSSSPLSSIRADCLSGALHPS
jgi:hypothetical protein